MNLMDLSKLGARQRPGTKTVDFGVFFPWVYARDGATINVKLIHELDQFIESIPALSFPLAQTSVDPLYDAYWSGTVDVASTAGPVGSHWGQSGQYMYRFEVSHPSCNQTIDWVMDPYAREFGAGKMSSFTLDYQPYAWSMNESGWKVPSIRDLVVYELHLGEFNNGIAGATERLDYLKDLGINCIELMPVSHVVESVEWGFQPIGFFGVDDRFGTRRDMQQFVDEAHKRGIAIILDVVFGHTGDLFPYAYLYDNLCFRDNPFMGKSFGANFGFGKQTDFGKGMVADFFYTVSCFLLDCFHVDGFRYDCVPEYWDPIQMRGYHNLVYCTYQEAKAQIAVGSWSRFSLPSGALSLIQCAEQLEAPVQAVADTYGNSTWQNWTFDSANAVATTGGNDRGNALRGLGMNLGLNGYPRVVTMNGDTREKSAFQYLENHDHPRFLDLFGTLGDGLFATGDRSKWYKLQPYFIAWLLADGVPMLWQGQELCEDNSLPGSGPGRVRMYRPVSWEYFYDDYGKGILGLVRRLLAIRNSQAQFRGGEYFFVNDWSNLLSREVLLYRRRIAATDTYVAANFSDQDRDVWFQFDRAGNYREELQGTDQLNGVSAGEWRRVTIPSNYGKVWTRF